MGLNYIRCSTCGTKIQHLHSGTGIGHLCDEANEVYNKFVSSNKEQYIVEINGDTFGRYLRDYYEQKEYRIEEILFKEWQAVNNTSPIQEYKKYDLSPEYILYKAKLEYDQGKFSLSTLRNIVYQFNGNRDREENYTSGNSYGKGHYSVYKFHANLPHPDPKRTNMTFDIDYEASVFNSDISEVSAFPLFTKLFRKILDYPSLKSINEHREDIVNQVAYIYPEKVKVKDKRELYKVIMVEQKLGQLIDNLLVVEYMLFDKEHRISNGEKI